MLDTITEASHAFTLPALLHVDGETLADRAAAWAERVRASDGALAAIQREIDERCFNLYGIDEADRRAITDGFGVAGRAGAEGDPIGDDGDGDGESDADETADAVDDPREHVAGLVAWAVGVAVGRFDVRLATGGRALPAPPEPFDPLPVCSPAMLTGDDGLPLAAAPAGYPLAFPSDGLLVDDRGHARDLAAAGRRVFDVVFAGGADARWHDAAAILDDKGGDLRGWLARGFFEHHLKRHSKSRRKAPILWQLATSSATYSVWLYAHRLTSDSFFQVQNDLVAPRLAHEERRHAAVVAEAGANPTASARKEIAAAESAVGELRAMLNEVKRVAPLWKPDLDDGVVLTMAPLWRLVPQHRAWQTELKAAWTSLGDGKYDWAHLAMHLWPERVVPKCAADRSLAIAHGLEDVFWYEDTGGKWKPRQIPTRPVEELVRERTSPAVKAALASLTEAPQATGAPRGGRRGTRARREGGA